MIWSGFSIKREMIPSSPHPPSRRVSPAQSEAKTPQPHLTPSAASSIFYLDNLGRSGRARRLRIEDRRPGLQISQNFKAGGGSREMFEGVPAQQAVNRKNCL